MPISTIIVKPTKFCSAQCTYCAAPPEVHGAAKWTLDQFKGYFAKLEPHISPRAVFIWHGGEPMLMGPDFYRAAYDHVRTRLPGVRFSIQTNLLGYDSARWAAVVREVFNGSLSTSYDPDERHRLLRGSAELYARVFWERLEALTADGFRAKVIGTYGDDTIGLAIGLYERFKSWGDRAPHMRVNYRYPVGREAGSGALLDPDAYGKALVELYDRWIVDVPGFGITPVDEMFKRVIRLEGRRCPWTGSCAGGFLGIEPDGTVYNCPDFADLCDPAFAFGNINTDTIPEMLASPAAVTARRRRVMVPDDCKSCRHFGECEGGCMRDAYLYGRGLGGKFYYCRSWMMVFDRIKETVASGAADATIRSYRLNPDVVRRDLGMAPLPTDGQGDQR